MTQKIFRIVLTGGPCGGKTTVLSHIHDRFKALGFNVYVVPEAATLMMSNGATLLFEGIQQTLQAQINLIETQIYLENVFYKMAELSQKPSIIICDRGTLDSSAFVSAKLWQAMLDENSWTKVMLRDQRYEAIIHLVTAAKGAAEYYTLANNQVRTETPEQAIVLDQKIQNAWVGHSHLRVVDNSTDFAGKIQKVLSIIANIVGVPEPIEHERKFLVDSIDLDAVWPNNETISIKQTYLKNKPGNRSVERVRKRGQESSFVYTHTVKRYIGPGKNVENERIISAREYVSLLERADESKTEISKLRKCFLWNNQYFELDVFVHPHHGLVLLEAEIEGESTVLDLPPFIKIKREVTEEKGWSNYELSSSAIPSAS